MNDKPEYVYIMYPVELDKIKDIPLPLATKAQFPMPDEEEFVPKWYGNACFPEDEP